MPHNEIKNANQRKTIEVEEADPFFKIIFKSQFFTICSAIHINNFSDDIPIKNKSFLNILHKMKMNNPYIVDYVLLTLIKEVVTYEEIVRNIEQRRVSKKMSIPVIIPRKTSLIIKTVNDSKRPTFLPNQRTTNLGIKSLPVGIYIS